MHHYNFKVDKKLHHIKRSKVRRFHSDKKRGALVKHFIEALKIVFITVFTFSLIGGGYYFYHQVMASTYFQISKIEIKGNQVIQKSELEEILKPLMRKNIFNLNIKPVMDELKSHPWIETATLQRKFPDLLQIQTKERKPYARIVTVEGENLLTDHKPFVIKKIKTQEYPNLPTIHLTEATDYKISGLLKSKGAKNGIKFIEKIRNLKPAPNINFLSITINKGDRFTLKTPSAEICFSARKLEDNLEKLDIAAEIIQREELKVKTIDLTFDDQVVLTLL
jgi:cell division septal protein FtsQ